MPDPETREARYEALLAHATDLIAIIGADGSMLYQSPSGARAFGYDPDEVLGSSVFEFVHPDDMDEAAAAFRAVVEGAPSTQVRAELRFRRGDGAWAVGEIVATNMLDNPAVQGIVVNTRDVTERVRAESVVRDSERRFRAVFEGSLDAMVLSDDDRIVVDVNRAACELVGRSREEIVGRHGEEAAALSPVDAEQVWRERSLVRADGERRLVDVRTTRNVLPGQHLTVVRDVTEARRLEEQLRQAQKMEAIGRLAGGIAHDFNNLLTAISGYAALAANSAGEAAEVRDCTAQIERAAGRAAELTRQLLAFSRRQTLRPTVVDCNELVRQALPMLERIVGAHVEFRVSADPQVRPVFVDPANLEQVVMNLVVNAAQAMPRGGTLTISTENVGDDHVALCVGDTGTGMDEETLQRVFEPFFTTKEQGAGTGLGLSTVHGIVTQSGGDVRIESAVGRGTSVTVVLPAADSPAGDAAVEAPPAVSGDERVLVVDDDDVVRELTAEMLSRRGYDVTPVATPAAALELVRGGARPHVLVTDVVMPRLSGPELAAAIAEIHPAVRVVLTSGYSEHELSEHATTLDPVRVDKPFSADEIAAAVRRALQ